MPLIYLLYRCPRCGHDPMDGEKDVAICPGCGVQFFRGGEGGLIRTQDPDGEIWDVPGHRLTAAMEAWGEEETLPDPTASDLPIRQAQVEVRQSGAEAPVEWGGELLGFAEAMGEPAAGVLELNREELVLRTPPGKPGFGGRKPRESWSLLDLRAVQTSSSSLQFSPSSGGLVQLRFSNDSPFRWEALLRGALRAIYREQGLGEIVEFQPRIVAE